MKAEIRRRAGAAVVAALCLLWPVAIAAHDPGLSAVAIVIAPHEIVTTVSLAAADARGVDDLRMRDAARWLDLRIDGVSLSGESDGHARADDGGVVAVVRFARADGAMLSIRSALVRQLPRGHRQLVTVRSAERTIDERMFDASASEMRIDLAGAAAGGHGGSGLIALGVEHILSGYDHLLFLTAVLLGVRRLRDVAATVTAFTVAHSLTLGAAALGVVHAPSFIIEPLIAASVVYVGVENLLRREAGARRTTTFIFGLIHGFGFAGALQEIGIGGGLAAVKALACFNLGVEVGQLGVAALAWPMIRWMAAEPRRHGRLVFVCSWLVTLCGAWWLVERTMF